ncbi:complement resistance protein TraT [Pseudodesulfovibrio tunisiensis]|uniref:complement resistance protein TraT n=1 Tax=Pseudodesulfovibrio tunisiensis TaxID=463192 RepID=UPI001FB474B3|nr:complement resistance protein TraT [Pseudodesulfovibrio tunisiensis]
MRKLLVWILAAWMMLLVAACVSTQKNRYKLVKDPGTGFSYGAVKSGEFVTDPAMYRDNRLKLRIRNTSGDPDLDMYAFRTRLEQAYSNLGYEVVHGSGFGILLDVNVRYFGQVTDMLPREYTFLGTAMGGVAGAAPGIQGGRSADTVTGGMAGMVIGTALAEIMRNYATEETFIIVSSVSLATVVPDQLKDETTISFVTGRKIKEKKKNFRGFRSRDVVDLAVYAGGRMISKGDVMNEVRDRYARILRDII